MTVAAFESKLQARLERVGLVAGPGFVERAWRYYALLQRWNAATNLTALPLEDFPAATLDRLFVEPLQAAPLIDDAPLHCLDVGSGSGSPAIPLILARPDLRLTMVESVAKKGAFLREAVREVGLTTASVIGARIEDVDPEQIERADVILIRGVRIDAPLMEVLRRLLKPEGRVFRFGATGELLPTGFTTVDQRPLATGGQLTVFRTSK